MWNKSSKGLEDAFLMTTICPEAIAELIHFTFRDVKTTLRRQKLILPEAQAARHYVTEITLKSLVRITAPKNNSKTISVMQSLRYGAQD